MATKKKMLQAAAGVGGAGPDITDVFSTYLYDGTGSTQTINNGIDLAGEGGLVWTKNRSITAHHRLFDTERGVNEGLGTNITNAEVTLANSVTAFNSNGFSLGSSTVSNASGNDYASWTFRKAPKFFDVVTYTGDGSNNRQISHNLGATVGCMIVKRTDVTKNWKVYHRKANATPENGYLTLNSTADWYDELNEGGLSQNQSIWWYTAPTATDFTVSSDVDVNASGGTYVAYLFAHNDGDADFGPTGDQDIIKCGSYTGTGTANDLLETLGFEPQWMLVKRTNAASDWIIVDNMRGAVAGGDVYNIYANQSNAEVEVGSVAPDAVGIRSGNTAAWGESNASGGSYIYMAIRRGPLAPPESGTEVAHIGKQSTGQGSSTSLSLNTGFPVDFILSTLHISGYTTPRHSIVDRLRGFKGTSSSKLITHSTVAEGNAGTTLVGINGDSNSGIYNAGSVSTAYRNNSSLALGRAPGFFDVVAYSGNGTAGRTVSHNLGVAPEMLITKSRSGTSQWRTYVEALGPTKYLEVQSTSAPGTSILPWNDTAPTATDFTLGATTSGNASGQDYIAYLFATLPGISKVGSYTGNGSSQTIDCGFTSGARFVLIKRTDSSGDWVEFDTTKGIVAGNDPFVILNSDADKSGVTGDHIDPDSSGFIVNQVSDTNINVSSAEYIFYAIA